MFSEVLNWHFIKWQKCEKIDEHTFYAFKEIQKKRYTIKRNSRPQKLNVIVNLIWKGRDLLLFIISSSLVFHDNMCD